MRAFEVVRRHGQAFELALPVDAAELPARYTVGLLVVHGLGVVAIARVTLQPLWLLALPLLALQPIAWSWRARAARWRVEALAPLFIAYAVLLARAGFTLAGRAIPEPWGNLLDVSLAAQLALLWALAAQLSVTLDRALNAGLLLILGCLIWALTTYVPLRAAGVTASDPYGYVQMATDLAEHGTPIHTFAHVPPLAATGLSPWPMVPVGYNAPDVQTGQSTSVWPAGFSVFLALARRIGGEPAMYLVPPIFGLLALLSSAWLSLEVLRVWPSQRRFLVAGVSTFILATSFTQLEPTVKPMSDIAAQTFVTLSVTCSFAGLARRPYLFAALSGLALGLAFAMRSELVVVALALACAWWSSPRALVLSAVCAFLPALPVFAYNALAFGSPFAVGSTELPLIALANVAETAAPLAASMLASDEFLYLVPFLMVGGFVLWRAARQQLIVLGVWIFAVVAVHVPYIAVSVRHLLPMFPALALISAVGVESTVRAIGSRVATTRTGAAATLLRSTGWIVLIGVILAALYARASLTLDSTRPAARDSFRSFGYLHAAQRAAFSTLANLIPPDAVVATTLNAGPIELYAQRAAVRPADWTADEWRRFLAYATARGQAVYLLVDGDRLREPLATARAAYRVSDVAKVPAHYFSADAGSVDIDVLLVRIEP